MALSLTEDRTLLTLRPLAPLAEMTLHSLALAGTIRGADGSPLKEEGVVSTFTTGLAPGLERVEVAPQQLEITRADLSDVVFGVSGVYVYVNGSVRDLSNPLTGGTDYFVENNRVISVDETGGIVLQGNGEALVDVTPGEPDGGRVRPLGLRGPGERRGRRLDRLGGADRRYTLRVMRGQWLLLAFALLPGVCSSRPPAVAGSETAGGECPLAVSEATVWLHGAEREGRKIERVEVAPVFFQRQPTAGTKALVVPFPRGEAVRLRVAGAEPQEDSSLWLVKLEDAKGTSLRKLRPSADRRPEAPGEAVVLWPAPEGQVQGVTPPSRDLPPGVSPEIVKTALDLGGEAGADVLIVEFCCGQRQTRRDCEYFCGETWQRVKGHWVRCSSWQPA